jgi:UDP:flavonoid glycosyltransferase YjiC (YdhE family)
MLDRVGKLKLEQLKLRSSDLYLTVQQVQNYRDIIKAHQPMLVINCHGIQLRDDGYDAAVDQLGLKMVNEMFTSVLTCGTRILHSLINSSWDNYHVTSTPDTHNIADKHTITIPAQLRQLRDAYQSVRDNKDMDDQHKERAARVVANVLEQSSKDSNTPWIHRQGKVKLHKKLQVMYLGIEIGGLSILELTELMRKYRMTSCYGLVPQMGKSKSVGVTRRLNSPQPQFVYDGSDKIYVWDSTTYEMCTMGTPQRIAGNVYRCTTVGGLIDHNLVRFELCNVETYYTSPVTATQLGDSMTIKLPMVQATVEHLVGKGHLLKTVELQFPKKMFRNLCLRMLREDTNFKDLLNYARVQSHAVYYSNKGKYSKVQETADQMVEASVAAFVHMSNMQQSYKMGLSQLLPNAGGNSTWTQQVATEGGKLLDLFMGKLYEIQKVIGIDIEFSEFVSIMKDELLSKSDHNLIHSSIETWNKMKVELEPERRVFLSHKPTTKGQAPEVMRSTTSKQSILTNVTTAALTGVVRTLGKFGGELVNVERFSRQHQEPLEVKDTNWSITEEAWMSKRTILKSTRPQSRNEVTLGDDHLSEVGEGEQISEREESENSSYSSNSNNAKSSHFSGGQESEEESDSDSSSDEDDDDEMPPLLSDSDDDDTNDNEPQPQSGVLLTPTHDDDGTNEGQGSSRHDDKKEDESNQSGGAGTGDHEGGNNELSHGSGGDESTSKIYGPNKLCISPEPESEQVKLNQSRVEFRAMSREEMVQLQLDPIETVKPGTQVTNKLSPTSEMESESAKPPARPNTEVRLQSEKEPRVGSPEIASDYDSDSDSSEAEDEWEEAHEQCVNMKPRFDDLLPVYGSHTPIEFDLDTIEFWKDKSVLLSTTCTQGDLEPLLALGFYLRAAGATTAYFCEPQHKTWIESYGHRFISNNYNSERRLQNLPGLQLKHVQNLLVALDEDKNWAETGLASMDVRAEKFDIVVETPFTFVGREFAEYWGATHIWTFVMQWDWKCPAMVSKHSINKWRHSHGLPHKSSSDLSRMKGRILTTTNFGFPHGTGHKVCYPTGALTISRYNPDDTPDLNNTCLIDLGSSYHSLTLDQLCDIADVTCREYDLVVLRIPSRITLKNMFCTSEELSTKLPANLEIFHWINHYSWFEKLDCVIHHGGASTSLKCLLSSTRQIILPNVADQPAWANWVQDNHVGAALLSCDLDDILQAHKIAKNVTGESLGQKLLEIQAEWLAREPGKCLMDNCRKEYEAHQKTTELRSTHGSYSAHAGQSQHLKMEHKTSSEAAEPPNKSQQSLESITDYVTEAKPAPTVWDMARKAEVDSLKELQGKQNLKNMRILIINMGSYGDIRLGFKLSTTLTKAGATVVLITHADCQEVSSKRLKIIKTSTLSTSLAKAAQITNTIIGALTNLTEASDIQTSSIESIIAELKGVKLDFDLVLENPYTYVGAVVAEFNHAYYMQYNGFPWPKPSSESKLTLGANLKQSVTESAIAGNVKQLVNNYRASLGLEAKSVDYITSPTSVVITTVEPIVTSTFSTQGNHMVGQLEFTESKAELDGELAEAFRKNPGKRLMVTYGSMDVPTSTTQLMQFINLWSQSFDMILFIDNSEQVEQMMFQLDGHVVEVKGKTKVLSLGGHASFVQVRKHLPHSSLEGLLDAVIHHGGAGTTQFCLTRGLVQFINPQFGDQFTWGKVIVKLGVGTLLTTDELLTHKIDDQFMLTASYAAGRVMHQMLEVSKTKPTSRRLIRTIITLMMSGYTGIDGNVTTVNEQAAMIAEQVVRSKSKTRVVVKQTPTVTKITHSGQSQSDLLNDPEVLVAASRMLQRSESVEARKKIRLLSLGGEESGPMALIDGQGTVSNYKLIYDPNDDGRCAVLVFERFLALHNIVGDLTLAEALAEINQDAWLNIDKMATLAYVLGLNVCFITELNTFKLIKWYNNKPTIELLLLQSPKGNHVQLVKSDSSNYTLQTTAEFRVETRAVPEFKCRKTGLVCIKFHNEQGLDCNMHAHWSKQEMARFIRNLHEESPEKISEQLAVHHLRATPSMLRTIILNDEPTVLDGRDQSYQHREIIWTSIGCELSSPVDELSAGQVVNLITRSLWLYGVVVVVNAKQLVITNTTSKYETHAIIKPTSLYVNDLNATANPVTGLVALNVATQHSCRARGFKCLVNEDQGEKLVIADFEPGNEMESELISKGLELVNIKLEPIKIKPGNLIKPIGPCSAVYKNGTQFLRFKCNPPAVMLVSKWRMFEKCKIQIDSNELRVSFPQEIDDQKLYELSKSLEGLTTENQEGFTWKWDKPIEYGTYSMSAEDAKSHIYNLLSIDAEFFYQGYNEDVDRLLDALIGQMSHGAVCKFEVLPLGVQHCHKFSVDKILVKDYIVATPDKTQWLLKTGPCVINCKVKAGGSVERPTWKIERSSPTDHSNDDWWGLKSELASKKDQDKIPKEVTNRLYDINALQMITIHEPTIIRVDSNDLNDMWTHPFLGYIDVAHDAMLQVTAVEDDTPVHVMDLWDDNDLTDWNTKYAPTTRMVIRDSEVAQPVRTSTKTTLSRYPIFSRAVLTKVVNMEFNAVSGRLGSSVVLRKEKLIANRVAYEFANTYFKPGWEKLVSQFKNQPVNFDYDDIKSWLKGRPGELKIYTEFIKYLDEGFMVDPLNMVNVHLKLEALLKSEPIGLTKQQQARIIVWQAKGICAMYSACFKKIKQRLKDLFHDKVIYADGLTPDELSARCRVSGTTTHFVENDFTKQDRQTDWDILNCELAIYEMLGLHESVLQSWPEVHKQWKFVGKHLTGTWDAMRLTGQATTALGNALVNLMAHMHLFNKNKAIINLMMVLGDDMLCLTSQDPDVAGLRKQIERRYNMQSKSKVDQHQGTFCCMIAYKTKDGLTEMGPDYIRLRRRFEVTNGVHEATEENMNMRSMSYAMMLGPIPQVTSLKSKLQWPIEPIMWYNQPELIDAICAKYELSNYEVESDLGLLCNMMETQKTYEHTYMHITPSK